MSTSPPSSPPIESVPGYRLAEAAAWWALSRRAADVVILDLRGRSDVCDFFVLATGTVETQVRAIVDAVGDGLARRGDRPHHIEGMQSGRWGLLDYLDVVVHVFQPQPREYYNLERLWSDAPRFAISDEFFADPAVRARHPWLAEAPDAPCPPTSPGRS